MTTDIDFLSVEDVVTLHDAQLERYGGGTGVRSQGGFESAVGTPQASFGGNYLHEGLFEMAAAYAFHIAQAQSLVDGNKRTGFLAALIFLELNGFTVADPKQQLYDAMIAIAERRMDKKQLAALLRALAEEARRD